jgi:hypothetical protein
MSYIPGNVEKALSLDSHACFSGISDLQWKRKHLCMLGSSPDQGPKIMLPVGAHEPCILGPFSLSKQ